jgi:uncharacterized protein (DUF885 family)
MDAPFPGVAIMLRSARFLGVLIILAVLPGTDLSQANAPRPFATFVEDYFRAYYAWKPSDATAAGFHQYDAQLEDWSAAATAKRIQTVRDLEGRLTKLRSAELTADEEIDAEILDGLMNAELLDLVTLANWRKNPMNYISTPAGAIDGLIKRSFAPPAERLRSVIARLKATPALLKAAQVNVQNPPHEFTDLAILMAEGSVGFFRDTVRDWARQAAEKDAALLQDFDSANAVVVKAMEETAAWLKNDLKPRSKGSYAIGADNFAQQLLYEELVDIPLPRLLAIGEANLRKDHEAFVATAKRIDLNKTPLEVMRSLSNDHPTETELIPAVRGTLEKCRQFIVDHHIVTIPSEVRPTVMETPPYARNGVFAMMDTPGAYERKATEAYYYVTPTEKNWDARRKEEHLRLFNRPVMQIVTIHEAFPGHYIQFLYAKQYPTKTRKLTYCGTNVEGWAHYCEQMIPDEGYGDGDLRIRLAQLSEALLRDCRYVVGIKLHTQGMTVEEGAKVFEQEGFQEPSTAYEESRRGAYNPTYLYYTLGKLMIYKLRDDYRRAKGSDFRLETFHNEFVRQGGIPIKLIRRILLPGGKGPTL